MPGDQISNPDLLIIPGSKNTIEDLIYLRNSGLEEQILRAGRKDTTIFGICGGYQMLGNTLKDPYHTESNVEEVNGLGLLDIDTVFEKEKTTTQVEGFINETSKKIKGYEIHMGKTYLKDDVKPYLTITDKLGEKVMIEDGAINKNKQVIGTYVHGIFDDLDYTRDFINKLRLKKGLKEIDEKNIETYESFKNKEYERLAKLLEENLDIESILSIIKQGMPND